MNYKELLHRALLLISSPARAWEEIGLEEDRRRVQVAFVYPMIALCALSVFIGALIERGWSGPECFQYAMTRCCAEAVSLFGGYFLAAYLVAKVCGGMIGDAGAALSGQLVGYSMVVCFVLHIVVGLLPEFTIVAMLLQYYVFHIVWEGSRVLMQVAEASRLRFTVIAAILLLLCPALIAKAFDKLMVFFN